MAVGENNWPQMHVVKGLRLGVVSAGIKESNRDGKKADVLVLEIPEGASVSGVFTQNAFCAAPVVLGRKHLASGGIRYLVINSGNANACTGERGMQDAIATCEKVAELSGCDPEQVIPFSTGVIGEYLPMDRLLKALPAALTDLDSRAWGRAAKAIMTTDTRPKGASIQLEIGGKDVAVSGISKGAGMIRPNMATMLAYIATDAAVAQPVLDRLSLEAANKSFNRISIDGDTSTNDACMLVATGESGAAIIESEQDEGFSNLKAAVLSVYQSLAQSIIRDGEGATKFVAVHVEGGGSESECLKVAYAISHSPLVKTALFAADPNWGRIVAAIGYSGVENLDANAVKVWLDDVLIVENGCRADSYSEADGQAVVDLDEYVIRVSLGRGDFTETVWTSDLSHEYVTINAEYRT